MQVKLEISLERISGLLTCAFEGGSNYWYMIEKEIKPKKWTVDTIKMDGRHWTQDIPLNEGGALMISDEVGLDVGEKKTTKKLDLKAIENGLQIMAEKYPSHFGDFIAENDDAVTGDVFLQCCLYGEIKFS